MLPFIGAQVVGAGLAVVVVKVLYPGLPAAESADIIVPHLRGPDDPETGPATRPEGTAP